MPESLILLRSAVFSLPGKGGGGCGRRDYMYFMMSSRFQMRLRIRGDNSTALKEQTQTQTRRQTVRKKLREKDRQNARQTITFTVE